MRNFDSWCAEHIDNTMANTKRLLSALNEWENMLGRHIMEPKETEQDRVQFVKFLRDAEKKLEEINRDLYRADQNFVTAIESGSKPSYAYESKNKSRKRRIKESIDTQYYGVQVEDQYGDVYVVYTNVDKGTTLKSFAEDFIFDYLDYSGYEEDDVTAENLAEDICIEMWQRFKVNCESIQVNYIDISDDNTFITEDGDSVKIIAEFDAGYLL